MNDLVVKALAWAQLAAGQLPSLPQAARMTSDRPQPNSPGTFRDALALPGDKHLNTLWTCYNEGPQERLSLIIWAASVSSYTASALHTLPGWGLRCAALLFSHYGTSQTKRKGPERRTSPQLQNEIFWN